MGGHLSKSFAARAAAVSMTLIAAAVPTLGAARVAGATTSARPATATPAVPDFDHIVVITMENKSYSDIIGNPDAPYLNSLAAQYGVAGNFFAIRHPSLPNYLALTGGDTFGVTTDCNTCYQTQPNIAVDRVEPSGRTWKAYMESMPAACTLGDTGQYIQHHNPFVYYDDIRTNPTECANDVPYTQLSTDFASTATTPNYAWISPNICDDMHNCSIATGDAWLQQNVASILATPAFTSQNSLLAITFDEDDDAGNNQIPTILVGPSVTPGYTSTVQYNHYSLLKTIESAWNLAPLTANDAAAAPMSDFFGSPPPPSVIASDTFSRSVSSGWGSADTGGAWALAGVPSAFGVNGSVGTVSLAKGVGETARLLATSAADVDVRVGLTFDRVANGGGEYGAVLARRVSGGNEYRVRVHVGSSGSVALSLSRFIGSAETVVVGDTVVPGLKYTPGTLLDLHVVVSGSSPTSVTARVWPDGTTEPSTWRLSTTDATPVLQAPGAIGLWGFLAATATNGPAAMTVDNLNATAAGSTPPPPPPTLASDTFTRTVSSGWGTADNGGAWTVTGVPSAFGVNGSAGTISLTKGAGDSARLLGVSATNADVRVGFAFDRVANGGGEYGAVVARRVSNGNEYRVRVHVGSSGSVALSLSRIVGGTETVVVGDKVVAGLHYTPGALYDVHVSVSGTAPTSISARVWADGTTEPSTWSLSTTDATSVLQSPGAIGVWGFVAATATNGPATMTVDNLTAS